MLGVEGGGEGGLGLVVEGEFDVGLAALHVELGGGGRVADLLQPRPVRLGGADGPVVPGRLDVQGHQPLVGPADGEVVGGGEGFEVERLGEAGAVGGEVDFGLPVGRERVVVGGGGRGPQGQGEREQQGHGGVRGMCGWVVRSPCARTRSPNSGPLSPGSAGERVRVRGNADIRPESAFRIGKLDPLTPALSPAEPGAREKDRRTASPTSRGT